MSNTRILQARLTPEHKSRLRVLAKCTKQSMTSVIEVMIDAAYNALHPVMNPDGSLTPPPPDLQGELPGVM